MSLTGEIPKLRFLGGEVLWKMELWKQYKQFNFDNWSLKSIVKEIFDSKSRNENFRKFMELKRTLSFNIAMNEFGIIFNQETSANALIELFIDNAYNKLKEFIPYKDDIVVDVGAQGGDYSLLVGKFYGAKVFAFEPMTSNFEILKKNIELNKVKNIRVENCAIGNENAVKKMNYDGDMITTNKTDKWEIVKVKTLDEFEIDPDILKIDVEGSEMDVLEGAVKTIKNSRPKIILEVHSKSLKKQCINFLEALDYSISKEDRKLYGKEKNLIQNIFLLPNS